MNALAAWIYNNNKSTVSIKVGKQEESIESYDIIWLSYNYWTCQKDIRKLYEYNHLEIVLQQNIIN